MTLEKINECLQAFNDPSLREKVVIDTTYGFMEMNSSVNIHELYTAVGWHLKRKVKKTGYMLAINNYDTSRIYDTIEQVEKLKALHPNGKIVTCTWEEEE